MGEATRIVFTEDLADYARKSAAIEAQKLCPRSIDWEDIAQEAVFRLIRCPPKYDAARGSQKTLIYIAARCSVLKSLARAYQEADQFKQIPAEVDSPGHLVEEGGYLQDDTDSESDSQMLKDLLEHVRCDENRRFVRAYVKCGGNVSEAARQIGLTEGAIRYRLNLVAPKLRAAGIDLFANRRKNNETQEETK